MDKHLAALIRRESLTPASNLHIREKEDGTPSRTITGYAVLFNTLSEPLYQEDDFEVREMISHEAITQELLDNSDIKFTMFHDRTMILARSNKGSGTLSYAIDDKGVSFEFEAPNTNEGDKALELVRRGDLSGCSFAFATHYYDENCVTRTRQVVDGRTLITAKVNVITDIYDFTIAADPAYPDTSVEARQLIERTSDPIAESTKQVKQMRSISPIKII
jgi:hypothetical protein